MFRFKKYPILKWSLIVISFFMISLIAFGYWFIGMIPAGPDQEILSRTQSKDIPYLANKSQSKNGKILVVVTSCNSMGKSGKETGYELTEVSRAYYVFETNGFEVDIASPKGGTPPIVIDEDDMGVYDYAFLNDQDAQKKVQHSTPIDDVNEDLYDAIYFAGGKGAMFDFPKNQKIKQILRKYQESNKLIGAVCHGPAALIDVRMEDGSFLLDQKKVCSFTNEEELFLISDAKEIFPFLLQDKLSENGAQFQKGYQYLDNVIEDGNILTGQNPWSTWTLAEAMIRKLKHTPLKREMTEEEITINVLAAYEQNGYKMAKELVNTIVNEQNKSLSRNLIGIHSVIAAMKFEFGKCVDLICLLKHTNKLLESK
ncbi:type 1 glutamine amidotransferase domain-containing protein [Marinifilum caeruleilacunae]|uniref:Type 1 glutamine amidotransferase domain-containing protein n=1 Tax=Marinifilum caeruleilacunae TaxID=2499076 RepID=A0ABX1WXX4_9BACT|nr:type 1 glutamine amidotransferase domain-containing protein [Marinifilum caeruleilacunae]NOU60970.1 type 1 glutamine amidotransferase domain-containing protein [Marinifilum caeruleilacunae]